MQRINLYDLVGKEIIMSEPILSATGTFNRKSKYLVVAAYPYHVMGIKTCESGAEIRQCFSVGELITNGAFRKGNE